MNTADKRQLTNLPISFDDRPCDQTDVFLTFEASHKFYIHNDAVACFIATFTLLAIYCTFPGNHGEHLQRLCMYSPWYSRYIHWTRTGSKVPSVFLSSFRLYNANEDREGRLQINQQNSSKRRQLIDVV